MAEVCSPETSVSIYKTTWDHNPKDTVTTLKNSGHQWIMIYSLMEVGC
jgi:hypothetical protein